MGYDWVKNQENEQLLRLHCAMNSMGALSGLESWDFWCYMMEEDIKI
jgi:hypothetical protein